MGRCWLRSRTPWSSKRVGPRMAVHHAVGSEVVLEFINARYRRPVWSCGRSRTGPLVVRVGVAGTVVVTVRGLAPAVGPVSGSAPSLLRSGGRGSARWKDRTEFTLDFDWKTFYLACRKLDLSDASSLNKLLKPDAVSQSTLWTKRRLSSRTKRSCETSCVMGNIHRMVIFLRPMAVWMHSCEVC